MLGDILSGIDRGVNGEEGDVLNKSINSPVKMVLLRGPKATIKLVW